MSTQVATKGGEHTVQETPYQVIEAIERSTTGWILLTDEENKQFAIRHESIAKIRANEPKPS